MAELSFLQVVRQITPERVRAYLQSTGWKQLPTKMPDRLDWEGHADQEGYPVKVWYWTNPSHPKFASQIQNTLFALSVVERCEPRDLGLKILDTPEASPDPFSAHSPQLKATEINLRSLHDEWIEWVEALVANQMAEYQRPQVAWQAFVDESRRSWFQLSGSFPNLDAADLHLRQATLLAVRLAAALPVDSRTQQIVWITTQSMIKRCGGTIEDSGCHPAAWLALVKGDDPCQPFQSLDWLKSHVTFRFHSGARQ